MSLDQSTVMTIFSAVQSHALASGHFDSVNGHEVMNTAGNGIHAEVWVQRLTPARRNSGLVSTSGVLHLNVRVRKPAAFASDAIEPEILAAVDALMSAYSGDFALGGNARNIDLLGEEGVPLQAVAGWLPPQDGGPISRVYTIDLPIIVSDLWTQAP